MQSFKNLPETVSAKKPTLIFCVKLQSMSIISLEYVQQWKIVVYYNLLDNNYTKYQLNWIRTQNFLLNLFDIAVTLKMVKVTESCVNR